VDASEQSHEVFQVAQRQGWYVGIPLYDVRRRRWQQFAYENTKRAPVGRRSREWTVVGQTEEECVREMARCLHAISEGREPT